MLKTMVRASVSQIGCEGGNLFFLVFGAKVFIKYSKYEIEIEMVGHTSSVLNDDILQSCLIA